MKSKKKKVQPSNCADTDSYRIHFSFISAAAAIVGRNKLNGFFFARCVRCLLDILVFIWCRNSPETSIILLISLYITLISLCGSRSAVLVPWTCITCVTYISSDENRFFSKTDPKQHNNTTTTKNQAHCTIIIICDVDQVFSLFFIFLPESHSNAVVAVFRHKFCDPSWMARSLNVYGYCHIGLVLLYVM